MRQLKITPKVTNREGHLEKYLVEVSRIPLLTMEEEIEIARKIRQYGRQEDIDRLVKANLRFVISVAKQYQNAGLSLTDLISEGTIGLIKAAERFDESRGFKFISYAIWWVRQSILQAIAENGKAIRIPFNKLAQKNKVLRTRESLLQTLEREPSTTEIAFAIEDFTPQMVEQALQAEMHITSADAPIPGEENLSIIDFIFEENDEPLQQEDRKTILSIALQTLPERDAEVIRRYYGLHPHKEEQTFDQIGEHFGLSRERVRQIREKAMRKLAHRMRRTMLKEYI